MTSSITKSEPFKWVSVEDGLPKNGTWCIVCMRHGKEVLWNKDLWADGEWTFTDMYYTVTHWMSVELPKEQEVCPKSSSHMYGTL